MKKTFDYKTFADDMEKQASGLVPDDLNKDAKDFLLATLKNFVTLSGKALVNDESTELDDEQTEFICQVVAEWTFHKVVDLSRSDVPKEYWEEIMQKIAFTVFELGKQGFKKNTDRTEILQIIEAKVREAYTQSLNDLKEKEILTQEEYEHSVNISSIENFAEDTKNKKINFVSEKNKLLKYIGLPKCLDNSTIKHYWLFILLSFIGICVILFFLGDLIIPYIFSNKLSFIMEADKLSMIIIHSFLLTIFVILLIYVLFSKKLVQSAKEQENIQNNLKNLVNPNKMYERFGVDEICLQVGSGLLEIADPDQDGELKPNIVALRQRLTDKYGYVIPQIRIIDGETLDKYEYIISIRGWESAVAYIYPGYDMVLAQEWDNHYDFIPDDAIIGVDPIYQTQVYWIGKSHHKEVSKMNTCRSALDVIINHLEDCLVKNVDYILSKTDVIKLMELVRSKDPTLVNDLIPELISAIDIRKIFVNLIREKVSIKDIVYIFERLNDYARFSKNTDILSEQLRTALKHNICLSNVDEDKVLYVVTLSEKWEKILSDGLKCIREEYIFDLAPEVTREFAEETARTLMKVTSAYPSCENPIIIATPKIRRALYKLLEPNIKNITVISYSELCEDIKAEELGRIGE